MYGTARNETIYMQLKSLYRNIKQDGMPLLAAGNVIIAQEVPSRASRAWQSHILLQAGAAILSADLKVQPKIRIKEVD